MQVTIDWAHSQHIVWMYSSLYHKSSTFLIKFFFCCRRVFLSFYMLKNCSDILNRVHVWAISGPFQNLDFSIIFNFCFTGLWRVTWCLILLQNTLFQASIQQSISCGMTLESIIFQYWSLFIAPSTTWSCPGPLIEMIPQNITSSGCFTWVARSSGAYVDLHMLSYKPFCGPSLTVLIKVSSLKATWKII